MTKKIFIYEDKYSAEYSLPDLKTLFSTTEIFSSRPDISFYGSYTFNMDGLVDPLFVIPGGLTYMMVSGGVAQMSLIRAKLGDKFDYLGICAGGMLATGAADLFTTNHQWDPHKVVQNPSYIGTLEDYSTVPRGRPCNVNLFPDFKAIGAFYPNYSRFMVNTTKSFVPYRVTLDLSGGRKLDQLYILGPAFIPTDTTTEEKSEIVATYEGHSHVFEYAPTVRKFFDYPPAIVAKRATETRGARMITGTHIETCVKGSVLLGMCEKDNDITVGLPSDDFKKLVEQQEDTQKEVVGMLRRTFHR